MPNAFNFSASPFDCLNQDEQRLVRDHVDIAYFPDGATVLEVGERPSHLFVVIKGYVNQFDGSELVATYGPDDCFDGRGLVAGRTSNRFVCAEEVVAYQLQHQTVSDLIASNATFGALLFADLGNKLSALSQRQSQNELQSLTLARVGDVYLRQAPVVDFATDIVSAVRLFQSQRTRGVLVRDASSDPPRLGMFSNTSLQRAVLDGRALQQLQVGDYANFDLISVAPGDQIGDALATMLQRRVHRLVVVDDGRVLGLLESLDLFSFLANHSHMITVQIDLAADLAALAEAAQRITRMVSRLYRGGTRVSLIARLVRELNARLFERAWTLIAPAELVANSCLFVMGSEGRGEQLLKTDQDNGLVLRDGYTPPDDLDAICQRFSDALASFGYPPCPGHIMVNNPQWRQPQAEFARTVRNWLLLPTADSLMNLAIFLDAHAVCGDAELLAGLRNGLFQLALDNDAMLGHFAAAIDAFGNTQGWWNRLLGLGESDQALNLKKEGIFPLVHGVRSLALAHRIDATGTQARINALVEFGVLNRVAADELVQALYLLMELKLKAGLTEIDVHQSVSGNVDLNRLTPLERNLLKDALAAVKRFRALLHYQFKLERF